MMRMDLCPIAALRSAGIPFDWLEETTPVERCQAVDAAAPPAAARLAAEAAAEAEEALRRVAGRDAFRLAVASANCELHDRNLLPFLDGDRGTVLQVVRNPGWLMPYFSCALVSLGMLVHFGIHLVGFLRRRAA